MYFHKDVDFPLFKYDEQELALETEENSSSKFDDCLKRLWIKAMDKNIFRYKLTKLETKILPGKYKFVAQLNINRAMERRKPQFISSVVEPFNNELFNFTKVSSKEVLLQLLPQHWNSLHEVSGGDISDAVNLMVANVSPLEYCNSLLVPHIYQCNPQVLTYHALKLAVETMLISWDPSLKIGFNSLGAFASVNHQHFHLYYLHERLYIESMALHHLSGDCFEVLDFPSKGFAFQVLHKNTEGIIRAVMMLVSFLLERKIAHNLFMTRGSPCVTPECELHPQPFGAIRIFVWARKSSFGAKDDIAFNPALCELAGHLPIKTKSHFDAITEEDVCAILKDVCSDTFMQVRDDVKQLFS